MSEEKIFFQDFLLKNMPVDEALVKKLIEKITVFANHFSVEFKSGIKIKIEIEA